MADAEDAIGLQLRESASKISNRSIAERASELKANNSALDEFARRRSGIKDIEADILSNEGAEAAARPAQKALLDEKRRIQSIADTNLAKAEADALDALEEFKGLSRRVEGSNARAIVSAHEKSLKTTKKNAWLGYERAIGQEHNTLVSSVKIPVTPEFVQAHRRVLAARKKSLLSNKSKGAKP